MMKKLMLAGALVSVLGACVPAKQPLYYWGSYEQLLYDMYANPGKADPVTQIQKLTTDIQKAAAQGLKVAPGIHAHLGYMYALDNNPAQSQAAFLQEKALYPESAVFIDGLMARAQQGVQQ